MTSTAVAAASLREARSHVGDAPAGGSSLICASFGPEDVDHCDEDVLDAADEDDEGPAGVAAGDGSLSLHPTTAATTVTTKHVLAALVS